MSTNTGWYIWTIRPDRFDAVKRYIDNNVKEIIDIYFPTTTTEKHTNRGKSIKTVSVYGGYIFLKYNSDCNPSDVWYKINKHPFVVGYIGPCTDKELSILDK